VHITNINVPDNIIEAGSRALRTSKKEKNRVVRSQKYEEAAQTERY
jgi:ATP-dependent Clp protease ATP-binding subunit ClpC